MLDLVVVFLRVLTMGVTGHGLWLAMAILLIKYCLGGKRPAGTSQMSTKDNS